MPVVQLIPGQLGAGGVHRAGLQAPSLIAALHVVLLQRRAAVLGPGPADLQLPVAALDLRGARRLRPHIRGGGGRGRRGRGVTDLVVRHHLEGVLGAVGEPRDGARGRLALLGDLAAARGGDRVAADRGAVVIARGERQLHGAIAHLTHARGRRRLRLAAHGRADLAAGPPFGITGGVLHRVARGEDAGELRVRFDDHLVALELHATVAGDQLGIHEGQRLPGERVGIVLEHVHAAGRPRVDHRLIQARGDLWAAAAGDGELERLRHRCGHGVGDGHRQLDRLPARGIQLGAHAQGAAADGGAHPLGQDGVIHTELERITIGVLRRGAQIHGGRRAAGFHLDQGAAQRGRLVHLAAEHLDGDAERATCGGRISGGAVRDLHRDRVAALVVLGRAVHQRGLVRDQRGAVGVVGLRCVIVEHPGMLRARPHPHQGGVGQVDAQLAAGDHLEGPTHPDRRDAGGAGHPHVAGGGLLIAVGDGVAQTLLLLTGDHREDSVIAEQGAVGPVLHPHRQIGDRAIGVAIIGQHIHGDGLPRRVQHLGGIHVVIDRDGIAQRGARVHPQRHRRGAGQLAVGHLIGEGVRARLLRGHHGDAVARTTLRGRDHLDIRQRGHRIVEELEGILLRVGVVHEHGDLDLAAGPHIQLVIHGVGRLVELRRRRDAHQHLRGADRPGGIHHLVAEGIGAHRIRIGHVLDPLPGGARDLPQLRGGLGDPHQHHRIALGVDAGGGHGDAHRGARHRAGHEILGLRRSVLGIGGDDPHPEPTGAIAAGLVHRLIGDRRLPLRIRGGTETDLLIMGLDHPETLHPVSPGDLPQVQGGAGGRDVVAQHIHEHHVPSADHGLIRGGHRVGELGIGRGEHDPHGARGAALGVRDLIGQRHRLLADSGTGLDLHADQMMPHHGGFDTAVLGDGHGVGDQHPAGGIHVVLQGIQQALPTGGGHEHVIHRHRQHRLGVRFGDVHADQALRAGLAGGGRVLQVVGAHLAADAHRSAREVRIDLEPRGLIHMGQLKGAARGVDVVQQRAKHTGAPGDHLQVIGGGDGGELWVGHGLDLEHRFGGGAVLITEGEGDLLGSGLQPRIIHRHRAIGPEGHQVLGLDRGIGQIERVTLGVLPVRQHVQGDGLPGKHLHARDALSGRLRRRVLLARMDGEGDGCGVGAAAAVVDDVREGGGAAGVLVHGDLQLGATANGADRADGGLLALEVREQHITVGVGVVAGHRQDHVHAGPHPELVVLGHRRAVLLVPVLLHVGDGGGDDLLLLLLLLVLLDLLLDHPLIHDLQRVADHPGQPGHGVVEHHKVTVHAQAQIRTGARLRHRLDDRLVALADAGETVRGVPGAIGAAAHLGGGGGSSGAAREMDGDVPAAHRHHQQGVLGGDGDVIGGVAGLLEHEGAGIGDLSLTEICGAHLGAHAQLALGAVQHHRLLPHRGERHILGLRGQPAERDGLVLLRVLGVDAAGEGVQLVAVEHHCGAGAGDGHVDLAALGLVGGLEGVGAERGGLIGAEHPHAPVGGGDRHAVPAEDDLAFGRQLHDAPAHHGRGVHRAQPARTDGEHVVPGLQNVDVIPGHGQAGVVLGGIHVEPADERAVLVADPHPAVVDVHVRGLLALIAHSEGGQQHRDQGEDHGGGDRAATASPRTTARAHRRSSSRGPALIP